MSIAMVFLVPPPIMVFLLFVLIMCLGLHRILKSTTHTHRLMDHFHFLAFFCLTFLPMDIGLLCLSLIDIKLGIINRSYNYSLLVWLAMD